MLRTREAFVLLYLLLCRENSPQRRDSGGWLTAVLGDAHPRAVAHCPTSMVRGMRCASRCDMTRLSALKVTNDERGDREQVTALAEKAATNNQSR